MKYLLAVALTALCVNLSVAQELHNDLDKMKELAKQVPALLSWTDQLVTDSVTIVFSTRFPAKTQIVLCPESAKVKEDCDLLYNGIPDPGELYMTNFKVDRSETHWLGLFNPLHPKALMVKIPQLVGKYRKT